MCKPEMKRFLTYHIFGANDLQVPFLATFGDLMDVLL